MMATALRRTQIDIAWMLADAPDDDAAEGNEGSGGGDRDESDDPDGLVRLDPTSDRLHYAIVVTADAPWQRVGELLHADRSRVRLALSDTYLARRDGYLALRRARGEDAPRLLPLRRPPAARLDAVRAGRADAAVVLRPHPGLDASDLRALDDPDGLLPRGTLVARVRSDLLETHPELGTTLSP
jgi:glycine betaine/choline ABC-type transport system substrate-binding protein